MRTDIMRLRNGAPECLHLDWGLEHKENMGTVVGVYHFTVCTKVLGAVGTAIPLSDNAHHVPVAERKLMCKVTKIG